jgi:broad specificity phosphatase PhoE
VSPLKRAVKTFLIIKNSNAIESVKKYILSDLIREKLKGSSQVGMRRTELKSFFKEEPSIDYSYIAKEEWWSYLSDPTTFDDPLTRIQPENEAEIEARVVLFLTWITLREEKSIMLVSHSWIYKWITNFESKASNANMYNIENQLILNKIESFINK